MTNSEKIWEETQAELAAFKAWWSGLYPDKPAASTGRYEFDAWLASARHPRPAEAAKP